MGQSWIIHALTVPLAIDWVYPLTFLRNEEGENLQLHEVYSVIAMLLLPPLGVLAVFFMGTVCGLLVRRQSWIKAAFNLGQTMLSVVVGLTIFLLIDNGSPGESRSVPFSQRSSHRSRCPRSAKTREPRHLRRAREFVLGEPQRLSDFDSFNG